MNASAEMPRYQSHKKVWALKIASIDTFGGVRIVPADAGYSTFAAPKDWIKRYNGTAQDQGYYVVYDDGYASWSPSKAFEEGYTRL